MTNNRGRIAAAILVMLFAGVAVTGHEAFARAGGGRSFGGSGSRSFSPPSRSYSGSGASQRQATPSPVQPAPAGGGFLRSMGGGLLGGMLGGMLFSSLGFGGTGGGFGGGGIGMIEILLFCAAGYFIYTMMARKKREAALAYEASPRQAGFAPEGLSQGNDSRFQGESSAMLSDGIASIRRMDPSFDETRFHDTAMDIFFKIQGAWTNRNMATGNSLLTNEMKSVFQEDVDKLLREKKVNRLENIAVRKVEIVEAWQETGQDFIKAIFSANLLDYTTDDFAGTVLAGSKTEPVKFEECWTFTRPVGNNSWQLSAISQV